MIVTGLTELLASLTGAATKIGPASTKAVESAAEVIQREAQSQAPVRTGALRDSIEVTTQGQTAEVGPTVDYAPFVEYGTWKDAPQPFMQPAADRGTPGFVKDMEELGDL